MKRFTNKNLKKKPSATMSNQTRKNNRKINKIWKTAWMLTLSLKKNVKHLLIHKRQSC